MRILQVIDKLNIGGAERVAVDLTNILSENKIEVSFLSILNRGILSENINKDIVQIFLEREKRFSYKIMSKFSSIAKKYDIIHVHMRHNLKYVTLCKYLFGFKAKIVFHDHFGNITTDKSCPFDLGFILRNKIDAYIGVSKELTDWANDNCIRNINLLPNIVRKHTINQKTTSVGDRILLVGNIRKQKNYEFLIELCLKDKDLKFDIVGNKVETQYYNTLLTLIRQNQLDSNINIIENISDPQSIFGNYKLAIHVASSETGPLVLIEYMSKNLPFITYKTGEVVKQIETELKDLMIDNFETEQWINKINKIKNISSTELETLKLKMNEIFEKYYSEEKYFNQCLKIYNNVLNY